MSRCFPYPPPPLYPCDRASNDALIDSIKLQRDREKAEAEREREKKEKKEKKREKKERRREKKEKAKLATPLDERPLELDESFQNLVGNNKSKNIEENPEQLTRSGLTEEHEQPISSNKPSYSSDSTQNSNKRKRTSSPINTTSNGSQINGNTFRIRLPMQKHKEPVASASREDPCSTSGRTDFINSQNKYEAAKETNRYTDLCSIPLVNDSVVKRLAARPDNAVGKTIGMAELLTQDKRQTAVNKAMAMTDLFAKDNSPSASRPDGSTDAASAKSGILFQDGRPMVVRPNNTVNTAGGKSELYTQDKRQIVARPEKVSRLTIDKTEEVLVEDKKASSSRSHKKLKRACEKYMNLFNTWVPPPLENASTPDSDDQEWLFGGGKPQKRDEDKRLKRIDDASCCVSYCAIQPVAHYLPEADIYALPYALPF